MKRILLHYFLVFALISSGQNDFHKAYQRYNDIGSNLVTLGGRHYFTSQVVTPHNMPYADTDTTWLYCVDTTGIQRFLKHIPGHEITSVTNIIKTLDGQLLMVGWQSPCDYVDTLSFHFIMKLDTSGKIVFKTYFDQLVFPAYNERPRVTQMPDSSFIVINDSLAYRFSKSGKLIKRKNPGFSGATAICGLNSNWLVCSATFSAGIGHIRIDTSLVLHPAPPLISQNPVHQYLKTSTGSLLAFLTDGTLQKFSPQMVPGASVTAPAGEATLVDDRLYLLGNNHSYRVYDTALTLSHSVNLPKNLHTAAGIQVSGGQAAILTNGASSTYTSFAGTTGKFFGITAFPRGQSWAYSRDIGVATVLTDSAYVTATSPPLANVHLLHAHFQFRAIVKNYGTDTVKRFYLNCNLAYVSPDFCGPEYYREHFNGPPIAPGSTVEVLTRSFIVPHIKEIHNAPVPALHTMTNIVLYTTLPDMQFDSNNTNDAHTLSVTAPVLTGLMEQENDPATLSLFPNPARDEIRFHSSALIKKTEVIDGHGRLILTSAPDSKDGAVQLQHLAPGLYYLRLISESQAIVRKISKE